jgi:hypothetical protein
MRNLVNLEARPTGWVGGIFNIESSIFNQDDLGRPNPEFE